MLRLKVWVSPVWENRTLGLTRAGAAKGAHDVETVVGKSDGDNAFYEHFWSPGYSTALRGKNPARAQAGQRLSLAAR